MNFPISFRPEIEEDAIGAYIWYEGKAKGLGEDLLRIFYANAAEISWNPLLYTKVYRNFRRRLLRRFPYAIYFTFEDEEIIVYGLFNCARNPGFVYDELEKR